MQNLTSSGNQFGVVYVLLADTTLGELDGGIVEVYESEVTSHERKDRLEREGYRTVKIVERHVHR